MPYDVQTETQDDHVRVNVSGIRIPGQEVEDSVRAWKQVADACRSSGLEKILTIFELEGRLSPIDAYDIVARTEEFGWSHAFKLAVVDLNKESLEDNLFAETVAVNRAYQVMVFDNEADATDWLLN
jgi:hypothetical protein